MERSWREEKSGEINEGEGEKRSKRNKEEKENMSIGTDEKQDPDCVRKRKKDEWNR